jgi:hypothetical protein
MRKKSTLRKLPPKTREIARLLNELQSVSNRLNNRLDEMAKLEERSVAFDAIQRLDTKFIIEVSGGVATVVSDKPMKYAIHDYDNEDEETVGGTFINEAEVDPERAAKLLDPGSTLIIEGEKHE